MFKVLVVDDEPIVCTGICQYLTQSGLDIERVETAFNGFEALDYLRMEPFDLVIADIQMAGMNGLELMEAATLEQPGLPFIMISAHEKFDFVRDSLRLGARDYLVKPVELEDLRRIMARVLDELQADARQNYVNPAGAEREDAHALRQHALYELTTDPHLSAEERARTLEQLGYPLAGRRFAVWIVSLDLSKGGFSRQAVSPKDRMLLRYSAHNVMSESLAEWGAIVLYGIGNQLIAIVQWTAEEQDRPQMTLPDQAQWMARMLHARLKTYLNLDAAIGLSTIREHLGALPRLYVEAADALKGRVRHPNHAVFSYRDHATQSKDAYRQWLNLAERLLEALRSSAGGLELEALVREISACLDEMEAFEEMQNSCMWLLAYRLYGMLLEYGKELGRSTSVCDPAVYFRGDRTGMNRDSFAVYIREAAKLLHDYFVQLDETAIASAIEFMKLHYGHTALKLQDIANAAHMSPNYLSYLFKKVTGQNLWDALTEIRLEEAKRLLADTDLRRYEIAYRIGYESPEHFSRVFKKTVGLSPADYRKQGKKQG